MTDNYKVFRCKQIRDVFSVGNYPHNYSILSAGFIRRASQSEFEICAVSFFIMNRRSRGMKNCLGIVWRLTRLSATALIELRISSFWEGN